MRRLLVPLFVVLTTLAACDSGGGGGSVQAYCDATRAFQQLVDEVGAPEIDPEASPEEQLQALRDAFEPLKERVDGLRRAAPSEIRSEIDQLADAALELIDIFLEAGSVEELSDPELGQRIAGIQSDLQDAQGKVADFTKEECGIDLTDDSSG